MWHNILLYICVAIAATLTRVALLGEPPIYDEYFHLLAAENWFNDGTLSILDGTYDRAAPFTKLVAVSFWAFDGLSWTAARVFPSLISAIIMILIVTAFVRTRVGMLGAITCATFLIVSPIGIESAQFIRFYALQGLVFVAATLSLYVGIERVKDTPRLSGGLFVFAAVAYVFAMDLQLITVVGLAGVFAWIGLFVLLPWIGANRRNLAIFAAVAAVGIVVYAVLGFHRVTLDLWKIYQTAPPDWQRDTFYYHRNLRDAYPTFWPLFPLAALIALVARPRLAAFCILIFVGSVAILSLGIRNDMKYLYPSMPFFFVTWAIAFEQTFRQLWSFVIAQAKDVTASVPTSLLRMAVFLAILIAVTGFSIMANAAFLRSARLIAGETGGKLFEETRRAWPEGAELARPWVEGGAVIVTSHPVLATAYLGDYDISFNRTHFHDNEKNLSDAERAGGLVFVRDVRDGRPVMADPAHLMRVMECAASGIAVFPSPVNSSRFERFFFVVARDVDVALSTDQGQNMALIAWENATPRSGEHCAGLPLPTDGGAAERIKTGARAPSAIAME